MKQISSLYLVTVCLMGFTQICSADDNSSQVDVRPQFGVSALPPAEVKTEITALPPQVQSQALTAMATLGIPVADIEQLRIDSTGKFYYADRFNYTAPVIPRSLNALPSGISSAEVFSLHSKPGAANVLYIDVDGHTITGTAWNLNSVDPLFARPYDTDGASASFSPAELDEIAEIWYRVAEDYAMFDVDITTEDPGAMGPNTGRILITSKTDQNGVLLPDSDSGGVAYVNVFGDVYGADSYSFYSPALVYFDNLFSYPPNIAETASHEAGHNLGLSHDGTSTDEYYLGHGGGGVSWGPIMGGGFYSSVTQWSKGEYAGANNPQDDIGIIIGKMGARADDHAADHPGATVLQVLSDGSILSTTPQSDPFNTDPTNKGIINSASDIDTFYFSAGSGEISIEVTPSWQAWGRNGFSRGTNLDIEAALYDVNGNEILSVDPTDETNAIVSTTVSAGDYYLSIKGVGNNQSPYSAYGSQGQYYITGSIPPGDTTPPTPDPMFFAVAPITNDPNTVSMSASIATDESGGPVEYYFTSPTAGDSGWISSPDYTAGGLSAATDYTWQVKARDAVGNETALSAPAGATTSSGMVLPVQPAGDINTADPTYVWTDDGNATEYRVQIFDRTLFTTIYNTTHTAQSVCSAGSCSITPTSASLSQSPNHYWRVQARYAAGWSGWTHKIFFSYLGAVPGVVTPQAPLGDVTTANPTYQWQQEDSATDYRLLIYNRVSFSLIYDATHTAASICASGTCSITPAGASLPTGDNHYWRVRAKNAKGWGDWTDKVRFNRLEPLPGVVTPLAPIGNVTTASITLQWQKDDSATDYRVIVYDRVLSTMAYDDIYPTGFVCSADTCSITLVSADLSIGKNHYWRIRAKNATGWGDWTSKVKFNYLNAPPGVVTPLAPMGNITTADPTFGWQEDGNATDYRLIIYDRVLSTLIHDETYNATNVCSSGTCSITPHGSSLSIGNNHYWRVRAKNASGWGNWTGKVIINALDAAPGVVTPLSPMGNITTADPSYQWQDDGSATDYRVIIYDRVLATLIYDATHTAASVCSSGTCSITPVGASLSTSNYHNWRVRAKNAAGWGNWTGKVLFNHVDE